MRGRGKNCSILAIFIEVILLLCENLPGELRSFQEGWNNEVKYVP
jgi:hypothetical protein